MINANVLSLPSTTCAGEAGGERSGWGGGRTPTRGTHVSSHKALKCSQWTVGIYSHVRGYVIHTHKPVQLSIFKN